MEELSSKKLKGYGPLSPQAAERMQRNREELLEILEEMNRLLDGPSPGAGGMGMRRQPG